MTFGRIMAGLVVSGWLMAGANCADPSAETGDASENEPATDTTHLAAQNPPGVPTTNPQIPFPGPQLPMLSPNLDNPAVACSKLLPGSTFQGYLIERVAGTEDSSAMCPDITTSVGIWRGADLDLRASYTDMYPPQDAFFVTQKTTNLCLYTSFSINPPPSPLPTVAQRYDATLAALGYPNQVSRDMLGLVCLPPATANAAPPPANISGIPMCRKCALAHENAIKL